jgi:hypothetical protein
LGHSGGEGALRLQGKETAERVPLIGTPHGRALAAQAVEVVVEDGRARLFAPVTSRGEAVGVLELGLEEFPVEQTVADVALAAHFLAYVVIANRRYTDLFEWGQRSVPLSLAAEIQHRLLPGALRRLKTSRRFAGLIAVLVLATGITAASAQPESRTGHGKRAGLELTYTKCSHRASRTWWASSEETSTANSAGLS